MTRGGGLRAAAIATLLLVFVGGCAKSDAEAVEGEDIDEIDAAMFPDDILGLSVKTEDASAVKNAKRTFVEAVGLFSLRDADDVLQAYVQVTRFSDDARPEDASFRRSLVLQIGTTAPKQYRMADHTVYLTTGKQQSLAVWFRGDHMFLLGNREEYATPRSLLRELLEELRP